MDIFRVLTRGASVKKQGKEVDHSHFHDKQVGQLKKADDETQLTKELDFFRNKRILNAVESKKRDVSFHLDEVEVNLESSSPPQKISSAEDAAKLRKCYKGNVSGPDIPLPIGSFEDLITRFELDKRLLNNMIQNYFTNPTPIQCEAISMCLNERDIIACAPTGSGKTLAFLIPLIQQVISAGEVDSGVKGLIISPTKELASQIFTECSKLSHRIFLEKRRPLNVALLSKSLSGKLKNKVVSDKKYDIIVSTPLRLIDLVKERALDLSCVKHLIFDEADKLFDKTFLEQTDDILSSCSNNKLQKSMFSATIPSHVEEIAQSIMMDPIRIIIGHKEAANTNIEQKLVFCGNEEGKLIAIRQLIMEGEFRPPVIIFLESITRAKALFHELVYDKLNVDVIHAERTQMQRDKIIERFKSGDLWCLICTDVLARGVDFKGVNLVINYDIPRSAQAYVHRIGRTGRGGMKGKAVTLYTKQDAIAIKPIVNVMKQSGCDVVEWLDKASRMSKKEKNMIKKGSAFSNRKQISTVPKIIKQKKRQKVEMVNASKRRKAQSTSLKDSENSNETTSAQSS
ncbi:RNA-dependent ATPase ROK1 Ecym_8358 [Eremothecium cymbalariae DBVPG|uniref:ATP-dependent RNA helicase ROK1 n=1 Tax=Eremothecium cymbalariae (strain CBS 270.75 / DBVPG 7215 / KCTC 17166 / NRRL Y-17582) TaxID=931890 RepID=G8JXQ7_ERECY|nr:Hypothetical protein Ecym_8358 [Eremothecium cymbalariae DBVPG\